MTEPQEPSLYPRKAKRARTLPDVALEQRAACPTVSWRNGAELLPSASLSTVRQACMEELRECIASVSQELDTLNAALVQREAEYERSLDSYHQYEQNRVAMVGADRYVTLNVGGVLHTFSRALVAPYPDSLLAQIIQRLPSQAQPKASTEGVSSDEDEEFDDIAVGALCYDARGYPHIDRSGVVFEAILNFLRGYKPHVLTMDNAETILCDLKYYGLDALYQTIYQQVHPTGTELFEYGGGVTFERTRFRSSYCVGLLGERPLIQGTHTVSLLVKQCEYVGVGVVSNSCVCLDQEFHKTANCCVYYMTGVFYSNYPHHKKEEGLEKYTRDDMITIILNMDEHCITFMKNRSVIRIVPCSTASMLRFAVVMKLDSEVVILSSDRNEEDGGGADGASTVPTAASTISTTSSSARGANPAHEHREAQTDGGGGGGGARHVQQPLGGNPANIRRGGVAVSALPSTDGGTTITSTSRYRDVLATVMGTHAIGGSSGIPTTTTHVVQGVDEDGNPLADVQLTIEVFSHEDEENDEDNDEVMEDDSSSSFDTRSIDT